MENLDVRFSSQDFYVAATKIEAPTISVGTGHDFRLNPGRKQSNVCSNCNMKSPSTSFRYEAELFEPVESWLTQAGLQTKREFVVPWGVCDLVGLAFDPSKVEKRLDLRQSQKIGPVSRVELLLSLPDAESEKSISLVSLERKYRNLVPREILLRELELLQRRNFARADERGRYQKLNGWMPLHRRLVAVELKLSRVSEALQQAISHHAFADESYIALPMTVADAVTTSDSRLQHFKHSGVGILGVGPSECCLKLAARIKPPTSSTFQIHASERFWRAGPTGS